jgi:UDP-N-acetylglucosamine 4-epimerase
MNDEQPTINGDGKQSRDFTYIENYLIDIYRALCKALGKDIVPIFGSSMVTGY